MRHSRRSAAICICGSVGGDAAIKEIAGTLLVGSIGGDAAIRAQGAGLNIGSIGGDLSLDAAFPGGSSTWINIGGDATIRLIEPLNLTIHATVSGDIRGAQLVSSSGGVFKVVYGDGSARLDLTVGGDLDLGGSAPRVLSSAWGWWDEGGDFNREMSRLREEISKIGQEISQTAQDMGRELSKAYSGSSRSAARGRAQPATRRGAHPRGRGRMRDAEQRIRDAEQRRRDDPHGRVHERINDRDDGVSTPIGWSG